MKIFNRLVAAFIVGMVLYLSMRFLGFETAVIAGLTGITVAQMIPYDD